jgi:anti-sigma B factor antagonist
MMLPSTEGSDMDLALDVRVLSGSRVVLSVKGRLDAVAAPAVKAQIRDLVGEGHVELVCDLTQVGFLDSSGSSALVSGLEVARERGGFLRLAGLNEDVAGVFRSTMLDRVLELYPTVDAALA